ncbi:MAG TPA: maleylpyruvate isomerase N-terminal domain-containing protein, partial [Steroidobacteraceae bacterium]|nr:maleylpyruvate isomerase N-terminal domain-containing protein [Steroidobacteraceae bacterium]
MLTQAIDYRDECDALYALLAGVDAARFSLPTQFKRWTLDDVLGHLHMFDYAARLTLEGPHAFAAFWDS